MEIRECKAGSLGYQHTKINLEETHVVKIKNGRVFYTSFVCRVLDKGVYLFDHDRLVKRWISKDTIVQIIPRSMLG